MPTTIKPLFTIDDVEFFVSCDAEDPSGLADSFDNDQEIINNIKEEIAKGNDWAWCTIVVTAKYKGYRGQDYLGACSYESQQQFIDDNDYYLDMKQAAFDRLVEKMTATLTELLPLFSVKL